MTLGTAIDPERLARELRTTRFGRSLALKPETDSTQDDARRALTAGLPSGHVVTAEAQRAGRGSRGRVWESPAGTDLYVSIIDRLPIPPAELPPLTLAVGLAVAEACDELLRGRGANEPTSRVKWPNDVQLDGRKCAGVLIETQLGRPEDEGVVIGIGLNVNRASFPEALQPSATSLYLCHPDAGPLDRTTALCTLLAHLERRVDAFVAHGAALVSRELETRLAYLGEQVRCDGDTGYVRGVAASGALLLETPQGLRSLLTGRLTPLA
ncbi:MAG: biotin--[acetyl-CoA-carboxylase] ligase [Polyangiales bacterium]